MVIPSAEVMATDFPQFPRIVGRVINAISNTAERDRLTPEHLPWATALLRAIQTHQPFQAYTQSYSMFQFLLCHCEKQQFGEEKIYWPHTSRSQFSTERCLDGIHGGNAPCWLSYTGDGYGDV